MLLTSRAGIRAEFNANGSLRRFDIGAVCLPLFVGNEMDGGPTNLYLRRHAESIESTPLLGPGSPTHFQLDAQGGLQGVGHWQGIDYVITHRLAAGETAWFWHVQLLNTGTTT